MEGFIGNIISRVMVDRVKIPRKHYDRVEPLVDHFSRWRYVLEDFDKEKPETWLKMAHKISREIVEPHTQDEDPINLFLMQQGYSGYGPDFLSFVLDFVFETADTSSMKVVHQTYGKKLIEFTLSEECPPLYLTRTIDEGDDYDLYTPVDSERYDKVVKSLVEKFWSHHSEILIDKGQDGISVKSIQFIDRQYKGEMLNVMNQLSEFKKHDIRRVILLQGTPGTGKSTLCKQVAKTLGKKSIVLTHAFFEWVPQDEWEFLIQAMNPDVVILDDVDRLNHRTLEGCLAYFEDAYYQVPITLLTSNDVNKLPAAFRRPGRVDQVLEMPQPTKAVRIDMVDEFARTLGIDEIPEEVREKLANILKDHTGAHVRELMCRYKAFGWDYIPPENDMVFRK